MGTGDREEKSWGQREKKRPMRKQMCTQWRPHLLLFTPAPHQLAHSPPPPPFPHAWPPESRSLQKQLQNSISTEVIRHMLETRRTSEKRHNLGWAPRATPGRGSFLRLRPGEIIVSTATAVPSYELILPRTDIPAGRPRPAWKSCSTFLAFPRTWTLSSNYREDKWQLSDLCLPERKEGEVLCDQFSKVLICASFFLFYHKS